MPDALRTSPGVDDRHTYSREQIMLVLPEVRDLLAAKDLQDLRQSLEDWHEVDLADLFQMLEGTEEQLAFFRLWERDTSLAVFEELEDEDKASLLENLTHRERVWLVNAMSPDERADLFAEVEPEERPKLMALLSPKAREEILRLLQYPEESAGGLMTTAYVAVRDTATCEEATAAVRKAAETAETIYTVYAVDAQGVLVGVLSLKSLIVSRAETLVSEVMETAVISVNASEDQEEVAHRLRTYDLTAIPVIDDGNHLVGIVTVDDVLDVIREENTEDALRMAAVESYETPYLDTPAWKLARQRVTWLLVFVLTGFIAGIVLESYREVLDVVVVLTFFIPVLTGTGGNAGIQVSTTIIRGLATHEVAPTDALIVLRKELAAGLLIGTIVGLVVALRVAFLEPSVPLVATVACSIGAVVGVAVIIGGMLPLGLRRIGLDPALMSSPFITTSIDLIGLALYFEIAKVFLDL